MTIRMAIIGTGGISVGHAKRLSSQGVEICALCDPAEGAFARFRERAGEAVPEEAREYTDYRDLLAREDLDAVLVASPHTLHFQQIMDSLDAGCHVLAEKPLACNEEEVTGIIEKSAATGKEVVVSYQRRFMPRFRFMREFIRDESFGRVLMVQAFQSQAWMIATRGLWRQDPALSGGGQLHDSGSHLVDILHWLLPESIVEVAAFVENHGCAVDIDSTIQFRLAGGGLGSIVILGSARHRGMHEDITFSGDGRTSIFSRNGTVLVNRDLKTPLEVVEDFPVNCDESPDHHFVRVVNGEAVNESPASDYLRVIRFTQACWKSGSQGGTPIKL
ncbi:MAG: gfo/Idh/MocA family oxidoreductase [Lentisphaerae bacterium]|nr:MAG: gfo/Idh/MocA family oxidoreductase [Lentisphaerota bacterium]